MDRISIIYAYRDREAARIEASFRSLDRQVREGFEVIFIDYGSSEINAKSAMRLAEKFHFVKYFYLDVSHQLWNKSRALNYGIKRATNPYIFIADIDLIFHPHAIAFLKEVADPEYFYRFKMGYLDQEESKKIKRETNFEGFNPGRFGNVNGMLLTSRESLFHVKGYDEFYHFYGSEDVDLYSRLKNYGLRSQFVEDTYFYHIWHDSYENSQTRKLDHYPRLKNVLRINEQHYIYHKREKAVVPAKQTCWGEIIPMSRKRLLESPTKKIRLTNILAEIEHLLLFELPNSHGEIVEVEVVQSPYFGSFKYKLKKLLNRQTQVYSSLKEINDLILMHIIFKYHNYNYSYKISKDLRSIAFKIEMKEY
ncbi:glycosyltransferase [Salinimicrobium flavum]|uniref:Glycosyltransferase n=1 Tax=Salinimicrobium flavum TaxID=1737065 RepID=A0ABW5IZ11_9FLAO